MPLVRSSWPRELNDDVAVAPNRAIDDARTLVKSELPVALVNVSPPLNAMRVEVALLVNGYAAPTCPSVA